MEKTIVRRAVPVAAAPLPQIHPLLWRIYCARGLTSTQELEQELAQLLPYHSLKGMEQAVGCLYSALSQEQSIVVVGDFDADGATSAALAVSALRRFGAKQVSYLAPNRFKYGYGLTPEIVAVVAQRHQPSVIVTVDNGISSLEGVAAAQALGIQVVITDHHLPGAMLPQATAIVNPNQPGDEFPSKYLAGVGVIFYVMLALRGYLRERGWFVQHALTEPNMAEFLDLVALGTVADVVPLDRNNRILVQQGLKRMRTGKARLGIQALLQIANRAPQRLTASDLGFAVAPRLNAAGRLEDMALGIECLLATEGDVALQLAARLDQLNQERKQIETEMHQQAVEVLRKWRVPTDVPLGVCLYDPSWHQGVIGIVAGRIKERLHRPVIAFASVSADELKGSARSVPGLHIRDVLAAIATSNPQLITRFGGHAMAAGLSLHPSQLSAFSAAFAAEVARHVSHDDLRCVLHSDGELAVGDMNIEVADMLREAGPWGQSFPEPLFDNEFTLIEQRLVGAKHLKMVLGLGAMTFPAIAFHVNVDLWPNHRVSRVRVAYRLDVNEYRGLRSVQLLVEWLQVIE